MQQFVLVHLIQAVVKNCAQRVSHLEGTVRLEVFAYSLKDDSYSSAERTKWIKRKKSSNQPLKPIKGELMV